MDGWMADWFGLGDGKMGDVFFFPLNVWCFLSVLIVLVLCFGLSSRLFSFQSIVSPSTYAK